MTIIKQQATTKAIEGNKLIAEFMGGFTTNDLGQRFYHDIEHSPDDSYGKVENLKYHSSWDWLMPVVEKIGKGRYKSESGGTFQAIPEICLEHTCFGKSHWATGEVSMVVNICRGKTMLENTWLAVVEFIKWHNSNSK